MSGKRIGYARVSTFEQNPDRQLSGVELDKKFVDYSSGKDIQRPQLNALLDYAREDDIVFVDSMDRLARNVRDLQDLVRTFTSEGITIQFMKENLTFTGNDSPLSNLLLMLLGWVAEMERKTLLDRQKYGIEQAKKAGKYQRKTIFCNELEEKIRTEMLITRKMKDVAKNVGIARCTLYKFLKIMKAKDAASWSCNPQVA